MKPDFSYQDAKDFIEKLPMSWCPALLLHFVEHAYRKKVFVTGGASRIIAKYELDRAIAKEKTIIIAKDQPEYLPLPAHRTDEGTVTCCWELTWKERLQVLFGAKIWHQILTFNQPLQPQLLTMDKPEMGLPSKPLFKGLDKGFCYICKTWWPSNLERCPHCKASIP